MLALVVPVVVGAASAAQPWRGAGEGALTAVLVAGVPHLLVARGVRRGRLGDRHLQRRQERPAVLAATLVPLAAALVVLHVLGAPRALSGLVVAMVAGAAVTGVVSLWWKVSLHAAVAAGSVAAVAVVTTPWAALGGVLVVATAWSRVALGAHTVAQVVVGALLGAVVAGGVVAAL